MLGKINADNYERCYPSRLKKYFQSNLNYKTYENFVPNAKRAIIGNIPPEIINLFPQAEREGKIKLFQAALAQIIPACKAKKEISEINQIFLDGIKYIMPEGTQSEIKYIAQGGYKKVYKLSLSDKDGKKIMHDKALLVYEINNGVLPRKSHGVYAEPNSWYYLQKNIGCKIDKTQFIKHYMSDMENGYSLTEFVDEDIPKTTKEFEHNKILGLILTDRENNCRIHGKIYDIGGMVKIVNVPHDRLLLKYFKKIANRNTQKEREQVVAQLTEQAKNTKTPHRNKIIKALEYYNSLPPWYWVKTSETVPIRMIW